ncbi:hypothetical protein [Candidatus Methylomirabilis sp.]|uniref:hypothetical protein n=1 Tax=Candidatus Methylomirabilis sp. TaxID=2032687 RepID=UPI002A66A8CE|nr:hypothetical protein [Candidatus Methylomirabilis sp.]
MGFFSATVGSDEAVIKRYVEFQEQVGIGVLIASATGGKPVGIYCVLKTSHSG